MIKRPSRPNPFGLRCAACGVIFAAGAIPPPHKGGRYAGELVCRDCRDALEQPDASPAPRLF